MGAGQKNEDACDGVKNYGKIYRTEMQTLQEGDDSLDAERTALPY